MLRQLYCFFIQYLSGSEAFDHVAERLQGPPIMLQYTVHLECPSLPAPLRISAEVRYARALERALGGPVAVVEAYQAWTAANESAADELSAEEAERARRWARAAEAARLAGFQEIGAEEDAFFEVRLADLATVHEV